MSVKNKRLFYKFNIAQRILFKYVNREMINRLGIPVTHLAALFYLLQHDGCLQKDLTAVLFQNKSATTTLVDRMIKNGLIYKTDSEDDGRASHIYLTDKGRSIAKQAPPIVAEYNKKLLDQFTASEIEVIHKFLDTIIENYS